MLRKKFAIEALSICSLLITLINFYFSSMTSPNVQITVDKTFHAAFFFLDSSKQGNCWHQDGQGQAGKNNDLLTMLLLEIHHQPHVFRNIGPELKERKTL